MYIGMTLDSLRMSGNLPLVKDLLNITVRGIEIEVFIDLIRKFGILLGTVLLLVSICVMISSISWGVVGFIIKVLEFGFFR